MYLTSPWVGLIVSVGAVAPLIMGRSDWPPPVVTGTLIAPMIWIGVAWLFRGASRADTVNPLSYGQIQARLRELDARLEQTPPGGAARQHVSDVRAILDSAGGFRWARGLVYVDVWRRLHRAMEELTLVETNDKVWAAWSLIRLRLVGSVIPQKDRLLAQLDAHHTTGEWTIGQRQEVRGISRAINEFRNDIWDQIVRARNQLIVITAMLGLAGYVLLLVALAQNPPPGAVITASIYFGVGAVVGLLNLALARSETPTAAEDYGLRFAQSQIIPVSAGIAAVFGVVLTAMVHSSALGGLLAPRDQAANTQALFELSRVFDLTHHPGGLLIAAIFGLTPRLLLDRLRDETERMKRELKSAEPSGAAAPAATPEPPNPANPKPAPAG